MAEPVKGPQTTAEAGSLAEHKLLRQKPAESKPPAESASPKVEEKLKPEEPSVKPAVPETAKPSESAEVSETSPTQKPKRDTAEDRIKELLRERDQERAETARLRKELETRVAKPSEVQPKPEAQPTSDEPDFDQYLAKAPADEAYAKTLSRFNRDHFEWMDAKRTQRNAQTAAQQAIQSKIAAARAKHGVEKANAAIGTDDPNSGIRLAAGVLPALRDGFDNGLDVVVHLYDNPAEYDRIRALPPMQQFAEVVHLAKTLNQPPAAPAPSEKPRPAAQPVPISRIPPPSRPVGGTEVALPKSTAEANSMDEHRRLRRQKQG